MTDQLPQNWEKWPLADVGQWLGGGTPSSSNPAFWNGNIPWVSPKDMKVSVITSTQDRITEKAIEESAAKLISAHSVLFVTRSGILAHSFPVATTGIAVTVNQDLKAIIPVEVVAPDYLAWALRYLERHILHSCTKHGTTVHSVEIPALKSLRVSVPPYKEQRRIVARVEELFSELDKGIEALTTAREQLKAYCQSVLKYAFEGKLTEGWRNAHPRHQGSLAAIQVDRETRHENGRKLPRINPEQRDLTLDPQVPPTWEKDYLGNLNVDVFDGPFGSHLKTSDYVERGIRVIRLENIGYGRFINDKQSFVSETKYQEIKRHTVVPGDIVFSSFVTDAIRSTLIPSHIAFAVNKADCFGVRFFGTAVNQKFVQLFLRSRNAFKQVERMIHGVGRPRINTSQLKEVVIPICSRTEQDLIVEAVESAFSEIDVLEAGIDLDLSRLASLRQSILTRAFSGQLVEQDPNDEPASVLLERIKAGRQQPEKQKKNGRKKKADREAA